MKRLLAAVLCFLLFFCACSPPAHTPPLSQQENSVQRPGVAFEDMEYRRPDIDALLSDLAVLHQRFFEKKSSQEREAILVQANRLELDFLTMYALADIRSAMDTSDPYYQQELAVLSKGRNDIAQETAEFYEKLLSPEHQALADELLEPWEQQEMVRLARSFSQGTGELMDQEDALCQQYAQSLAAAQPAQSAQEFCEQYYPQWSQLFLSLCQVRHQLAQQLGYGDFVSLGYDRMGRSCYGEQEVAAFREGVKTYLTPAYQGLIQQKSQKAGLEQFPFYALSALAPTPEWEADTQTVLSVFRQVYKEMSPSTGACMDYLLDYRLYDLEPRENKSPGGFQEYIYGYASPFLFGTFRGDAGDISLFSHEFGHFYAAFEKINPDPAHYQDGDRTMDIKEMQSSGMEVLTLQWYPLFFGAHSAAFEKAQLLEMFSIVLDCCMYDEWQHLVYHNWEAIQSSPDPAGECDRIMAQLRKEYYGELDYTLLEPYGQGKMWIEKAHVFETPFYMIDYALAYSVALQLYALSLKDWDQAFSAYQSLVDQPSGVSFLEAVEGAGLKSPFSTRSLEQLGLLFQQVMAPSLPASGS